MCNNGNDFVGELPDSVIDKWYTIGESFWLRRTTDCNCLCADLSAYGAFFSVLSSCFGYNGIREKNLPKDTG